MTRSRWERRPSSSLVICPAQGLTPEGERTAVNGLPVRPTEVRGRADDDQTRHPMALRRCGGPTPVPGAVGRRSAGATRPGSGTVLRRGRDRSAGRHGDLRTTRTAQHAHGPRHARPLRETYRLLPALTPARTLRAWSYTRAANCPTTANWAPAPSSSRPDPCRSAATGTPGCTRPFGDRRPHRHGWRHWPRCSSRPPHWSTEPNGTRKNTPAACPPRSWRPPMNAEHDGLPDGASWSPLDSCEWHVAREAVAALRDVTGRRRPGTRLPVSVR